MKRISNILILAGAILMWNVSAFEARGCTSAIVHGSRTATGRTLMWKHRDTGTEHNFVERIPATDSTLAFVALFNGGDSLLLEAWTGINEAGFAIMNTASYNLAPDTAEIKDREGIVMRKALETCHTMAEFEQLLASLPRPMGVQANFGVIDASGDGAYYETDDVGFKKFSLSDSEDGYLIRTNFSESGNSTDGMGYIRYNTACELLQPYRAGEKAISPEIFTEGLSRSFHHSLLGVDFMEGNDHWVVDQDFIPRHSSAASIVIEGVKEGEAPTLTVMWTALGYPPAAVAVPITVGSVPEEVRPVSKDWHAPACDRALQLKSLIFPIKRGSGQRYIDMEALKRINTECRAAALENYTRYRQN